MKKTSVKTAFSIFELSIVILVIGLVIAGITQGSMLIDSARLAQARLITAKSKVAEISDLAYWYDAVSEEAFLENEMMDGNKISVFFDQNIAQSSRTDAVQTDYSLRPTYYKKCINNLPCIRFDGTNFLRLNCSKIAKSSFTIFSVVQRRNADSGNAFFGSQSDNSGIFTIGYFGSNILNIIQEYSLFIIDLPNYSENFKPDILTYSFLNNENSMEPKRFYFNTVDKGAISDPYGAITNLDKANIGAAYDNAINLQQYYFTGDFGEMIIFNRKLNIEEINYVHKYLINKWKIQI